MKSPRRYRAPQPGRHTGPASPPETIELQPRSGLVVGPPVTPLPGSPSPEIIALHPRGPKPDPNRPLVPTETEVASLPRWARLAFAARCARRLLPLLPLETSDDRGYATHVADLVTAVEQSAATGALQSRALAAAAKRVKAREHDPEFTGREAVMAALAAYHSEGCTAAKTAVCVLQRLALVRTLRFVLLPRRDFDGVQLKARQHKWTDDTPVPPEVFGSMWDRDPPEWWREDVLGGASANSEPKSSE